MASGWTAGAGLAGRGAAVVVLTALVALPATARGDDWLAHYPSCAFGDVGARGGGTTLLYPRPGLPAVVAAGERLVVRVRLPAPLTPPPGIQQDRARVGWSLSLVGQGRVLATDPADRADHRYRLRVADVRPDSGSSMVYRATVMVPRWAAPGTYDVEVGAPGGRDRITAAVRILEPDAAPRVAVLSVAPPANRDTALALGRTLAELPVDVWVVAASSHLAAALSEAGPGPRSEPLAAILHLPVHGTSSVPATGGTATSSSAASPADDPQGPSGLPVVLRVGGGLLRLGDCGGAARAPFERAVTGLAEEPGSGPVRAISAADLAAVPTAHYRLLGEPGPDRALSTEGVSVVVGEIGLRLHNPDRVPRVFSLIVPIDGRSTRAEGGTLAFWPATAFARPDALASLAARLTIAPGRSARITRPRGAAPSLAIAATPAAAASGQVVTWRAVADGSATVHWQLAEDTTATGTRAAERYVALGRHEVHALAITRDGRSAETLAVIEVETVRRVGYDCAMAGPAVGVPSPSGENRADGHLGTAHGVVGGAGRRPNLGRQVVLMVALLLVRGRRARPRSLRSTA